MNRRLEGKKRDNDASPVQDFPGKRPYGIISQSCYHGQQRNHRQCIACVASIHPRKQPELRLSLTRIQERITFPSVNGV
jgi:hypothetical protein